MKNLKGFTLIEVLVTMGVIVSLGALIVSIFVASLRSTTKIQNLNSIRENGSYALTQMTKMLQFPQTFNGVSTDGSVFTTTCQAPGSGSAQRFSHVRLTGFDNGLTTFSCTSNQTIASNSASMIDNTKFEISSCYFTCTKVDQYSSPTVGIFFTIRKRNANNILDDPTPMDFSTSVTIRNNQ